MKTRVLRLLVPALLLSASWSRVAGAETCMDVGQFNTFMSSASGPTTKVTLTFDVTGVRPADFTGSKGCLAELLDTSCVAGSAADLKIYGPSNPPNASHPAGTLKFEFGNQCCAAPPCQVEGWANPNASATVFTSGSEKCSVKITLDPLHIAYHLDCSGTIFDAVGDNLDKVVVNRIATLKRVDGGWAMPNAVATSTKVCFEPPAAPSGVVTLDVPVLEDVTASVSSSGVYAGVQELGVEAGDSQVFLKFDLGAVPGRIDKAKLFLHQSDIASADGDGGDAFAVPSHAWSESTLTWSMRPATVGASLARVSPVAAFTWYAWDVSAAVRKPAVYAFAIQPEAGDANGAHFFSKEGSATFAPYLHVEYVVVDVDGDGVPDGVDCNDTVATVHPGAAELCDGVDDDCNGLVDEGCPGVDAGAGEGGAGGAGGSAGVGVDEDPFAASGQCACDVPGRRTGGGEATYLLVAVAGILGLGARRVRRARSSD